MANSSDIERTIFVNSDVSAYDIETAIMAKKDGHFYGTMYLCVTDDVVTNENKGDLLDKADASIMYELLEFDDGTFDVWHNELQMSQRVSVKDTAYDIHKSMSEEKIVKR